MKYLIAVGISLLFLSCAKPIVWTKADSTQLNRDDYECQRDAKLTHPPTDFGGGLIGVFSAIGYQKEGEQFYQRCMESKGWKKAE